MDGKAKHPAVLLQYGTGGNKSTNYITELGRQFVARGFVVLTIDVPNRGERRGEGWQLSLTERSFDALGRGVEERTIHLDGWPVTARPPVQVTPLR